MYMKVKKTVAVSKEPSRNPSARASMTILSSGPPGASSSSLLIRSMVTTCRPLSWPMTALAPAPDVEDEPLGRKIGYGHLELGMDDELRHAGTLLGGRGQR